MKFQYGTIFAMDYDPNLRLMALYPADAITRSYYSVSGNSWWAVVLADEHWGSFSPSGIALGWAPGQYVTCSPQNDGLIIVEDE